MVCPRFEISIHVKDKPLLEGIKNYLRVGKISTSGPELIQLIVQSLKEDPLVPPSPLSLLPPLEK